VFALISENQNPFLSKALNGGFAIFDQFKMPEFVIQGFQTNDLISMRKTTEFQKECSYLIK